MNDKELLELEEILEHPDVIDNLCEEDFHRLAEVYHRNSARKVAEEILSSVNSTEYSETAIKEHPSYPAYRFHIDEAVRHYTARPEEIREEEQDKLIFSFGMDNRIQKVLTSAAKALSGQLLTPEEQLHGTFD